jgi:hypothetical protein
MITIGLSQHEITLITQILEKHGVSYHVDAAGGSADEVNVRAGRGDTSFYQIEIPGAEFDKLPVSAKGQLEALGIYPEMEIPDFSETEKSNYQPSDATQVRNKFKKLEKVLMLGILILMALGFLYQSSF